MENEELDVGKLCTKAKSLFTQKNRQIVKTNPLSKLESATFGADSYLAHLVKQREDAENKILGYMEETLKNTRLPENKPLTVFTILEDALHALETQEGLWIYDQDGPHASEAWQIDNSDTIEKIKQVI